MNEPIKPTWDALPEEIRAEWIQEASNFYAPGTASDADIAEAARENYASSDSCRPTDAEPSATARGNG